MAYKFNPFTGNFDDVGDGGAGSTPGGSDTQVQFNDGGSFGGDSGLTFDKTTNALTVGASTVDGGEATVYGDINLDDGGTYTTTLQVVTPTANRTISYPDATGTLALVSGSTGQILYNLNGALAGTSITGLNLESLRAMQADGEELTATMQRVAEGMSSINSLFVDEADAYAQALGFVQSEFDAMRASVSLTVWRSVFSQRPA